MTSVKNDAEDRQNLEGLKEVLEVCTHRKKRTFLLTLSRFSVRVQKRMSKVVKGLSREHFLLAQALPVHMVVHVNTVSRLCK